MLLARYNLVVMSSHAGLEAMARLDDIQDFKQTALNYIEPGQNVVATMALYSDFRFQAGDIAHLLLDDIYLGFAVLKFIRSPG